MTLAGEDGDDMVLLVLVGLAEETGRPATAMQIDLKLQRLGVQGVNVVGCLVRLERRGLVRLASGGWVRTRQLG